ncbi:SMC-Scp complex subunit ScpB [Aerococcaceae bacterium DSM 111020]|nr:SMC-Scp complex subunit ScpB [Aerococcaceae bacterium DSM 111020]
MTDNLSTRIQAILFVSGDEGVTLSAIADALKVKKIEVKNQLHNLKNTITENDMSPVEIIVTGDHYRFITKRQYAEDVERFAQNTVHQPLTRAAIETLAIIAYRQPITRVGIDEIRGVSSQSMIQRLISRQLVREMGRIEAPGRPYLYGVTHYFLDYFGLSDLSELPPIESLALNVELSSEELFKDKQWVIESENNQKINEEDNETTFPFESES